MPAALKLASDGGCGGGPSMGGRPLSLPPLAEFRPSKRLHMGTRTTLKNFLSSQPGVNFFSFSAYLLYGRAPLFIPIDEGRITTPFSILLRSLRSGSRPGHSQSTNQQINKPPGHASGPLLRSLETSSASDFCRALMESHLCLSVCSYFVNDALAFHRVSHGLN